MLIYLPRSRQSAWHNMHKARIAACLTQRFRPLLECILKGCLSLPVRIWNMFSLSLQTTFPWFCIFFSEHFLKIWWWWNSKVIGLIEVCWGVVEIFLSMWCSKTRIRIESQYFFESYIQDSRIYKTGYFNVSSLICWPPLPLILWRLPNHYFSPFQSSVVGCRSGRWSKMIHHHQRQKSLSPDYQDLPVMGQQGSSLLIGGGGGVGGEELLTNLNGRLKNVQNSNVLISLKAIHGFIWWDFARLVPEIRFIPLFVEF